MMPSRMIDVIGKMGFARGTWGQMVQGAGMVAGIGTHSRGQMVVDLVEQTHRAIPKRCHCCLISVAQWNLNIYQALSIDPMIS